MNGLSFLSFWSKPAAASAPPSPPAAVDIVTTETPEHARASKPISPPHSPTATGAAAPTTPSTASPNPEAPTTPHSPSFLMTPRLRSQTTLLLAGPTFLLLSSLITRRALVRKRLQTFPPLFHPSNAAPLTPVVGALEAVEALSLATLNVGSFAILLTGGLLFALDIHGMEELRRRVRGGLGVDGTGRDEREVEEEWEEWIAGVAERRGWKEEEEKEEKERGRGRGGGRGGNVGRGDGEEEEEEEEEDGWGKMRGGARNERGKER